jgi:hypothetical protein
MEILAGHVARNGETRNVGFKDVLVGVDKPEGKGSLGRHKHSCKDNIKMGLSDRV